MKPAFRARIVNYLVDDVFGDIFVVLLKETVLYFHAFEIACPT